MNQNNKTIPSLCSRILKLWDLSQSHYKEKHTHGLRETLNMLHVRWKYVEINQVQVHLFLTLELARGAVSSPQGPLCLRGKSQVGCVRNVTDGTCAETRFRLSTKRTSPFKSAGASVQSTTGSRGVLISGSNAGYTMFLGSVKGTGYPLHSPVSPSHPLPCVTVCHHVSTGLPTE